jgi:hypothetical protein
MARYTALPGGARQRTYVNTSGAWYTFFPRYGELNPFLELYNWLPTPLAVLLFSISSAAVGGLVWAILYHVRLDDGKAPKHIVAAVWAAVTGHFAVSIVGIYVAISEYQNKTRILYQSLIAKVAEVAGAQRATTVANVIHDNRASDSAQLQRALTNQLKDLLGSVDIMQRDTLSRYKTDFVAFHRYGVPDARPLYAFVSGSVSFGAIIPLGLLDQAGHTENYEQVAAYFGVAIANVLAGALLHWVCRWMFAWRLERSA